MTFNNIIIKSTLWCRKPSTGEMPTLDCDENTGGHATENSITSPEKTKYQDNWGTELESGVDTHEGKGQKRVGLEEKEGQWSERCLWTRFGSQCALLKWKCGLTKENPLLFSTELSYQNATQKLTPLPGYPSAELDLCRKYPGEPCRHSEINDYKQSWDIQVWLAFVKCEKEKGRWNNTMIILTYNSHQAVMSRYGLLFTHALKECKTFWVLSCREILQSSERKLL